MSVVSHTPTPSTSTFNLTVYTQRMSECKFDGGCTRLTDSIHNLTGRITHHVSNAGNALISCVYLWHSLTHFLNIIIIHNFSCILNYYNHTTSCFVDATSPTTVPHPSHTTFLLTDHFYYLSPQTVRALCTNLWRVHNASRRRCWTQQPGRTTVGKQICTAAAHRMSDSIYTHMTS